MPGKPQLFAPGIAANHGVRLGYFPNRLSAVCQWCLEFLERLGSVAYRTSRQINHNTLIQQPGHCILARRKSGSTRILYRDIVKFELQTLAHLLLARLH